jgi:hypothetical protein
MRLEQDAHKLAAQMALASYARITDDTAEYIDGCMRNARLSHDQAKADEFRVLAQGAYRLWFKLVDGGLRADANRLLALMEPKSAATLDFTPASADVGQSTITE